MGNRIPVSVIWTSLLSIVRIGRRDRRKLVIIPQTLNNTPTNGTVRDMRTRVSHQPWASISKVPNNVAVRHMMLNRIMVHTAVRERKKLFVEVRSTIVTELNLFHSGGES